MSSLNKLNVYPTQVIEISQDWDFVTNLIFGIGSIYANPELCRYRNHVNFISI